MACDGVATSWDAGRVGFHTQGVVRFGRVTGACEVSRTIQEAEVEREWVKRRWGRGGIGNWACLERRDLTSEQEVTYGK